MALPSRLALCSARQACVRQRSRIGSCVDEQTHQLVQTRHGGNPRIKDKAKQRGVREYSHRSNYLYGPGLSKSVHRTNTTNTYRINQSLRQRLICRSNDSGRLHHQLSSTSAPAVRKTLSRQICHRYFATRSSPLWNATQEAPNAQAYLNSGVIAGARDLVDVKKVLVIGSGGLAIGQAGEFDYSGGLHALTACNVLGGTLINYFAYTLVLFIHYDIE